MTEPSGLLLGDLFPSTRKGQFATSGKQLTGQSRMTPQERVEERVDSPVLARSGPRNAQQTGNSANAQIQEHELSVNSVDVSRQMNSKRGDPIHLPWGLD
jgi:hypothetical protein